MNEDVSSFAEDLPAALDTAEAIATMHVPKQKDVEKRRGRWQRRPQEHQTEDPHKEEREKHLSVLKGLVTTQICVPSGIGAKGMG